MKVENNSLNPINSQRPEGLHPVEKNQRQVDATTSAGSGDKAEFSERAKLLAKARQAFGASPDVRTDRTDELKTQVSNGTYTVPINELVHTLLSKMNQNK